MVRPHTRYTFILKTHQMFTVHTASEELKTINGHFGFVFDTIIATQSFSKSFTFKMYSIHTKTKSRRFQIPLVWKQYRKIPFSWRISVEGRPIHLFIKLRFQIPRELTFPWRMRCRKLTQRNSWTGTRTPWMLSCPRILSAFDAFLKTITKQR